MSDGLFIPLAAYAVRAILDGAKTQLRWTVAWHVVGFGGGLVEPPDHEGAPTYELGSGHSVTHKHADISDEDAVREGVRAVSRSDVLRGVASSPRDDFRLILQRTRGRAAWCSNPWVWVFDFVPEVLT